MFKRPFPSQTERRLRATELLGDDATSAESALFPPRRSRPVERRKNRSWPTNAVARHVGSVALVIYLPELSARTESFRTSERRAAQGEASPICAQWRVFAHTERRSSAAKKLGGDTISKQSAPFSLFPPSGETGVGEDVARGGGIAAASALRPPSRTFPGRGPKSDVWQPIQRNRRSCRVAMDKFPGELTCRLEKEPIMANQLDHAPRRRRRLGHFCGGVGHPYEEATN